MYNEQEAYNCRNFNPVLNPMWLQGVYIFKKKTQTFFTNITKFSGFCNTTLTVQKMYNCIQFMCFLKTELPHDKTNKMTVRPAKTQDPSGHLLCAQWVAKDPSFFRADSKD